MHTENENEIKSSCGFMVDVNNIYGGIMKMHNACSPIDPFMYLHYFITEPSAICDKLEKQKIRTVTSQKTVATFEKRMVLLVSWLMRIICTMTL